jgi:hypothetical protein
MSIKSQLDEGVEAIRGAGAAIGTKIISALVLGSDKGRTLTVGLERADFVELIAHVRPPVLYLWEQQFEAKTMAIANLEGDGDWGGDDPDGEAEPEIVKDARFKSLTKRWRAHDGQLSRFAASFMAQGILHTTIEAEVWVDKFESEVEQLAEQLSQEGAEEESRLNAADEKDIRDKARLLAADPLFSAPKGSRAKREYLASDLFPSIDDRTISRIVEEAEKIEWLQAGRRKA